MQLLEILHAKLEEQLQPLRRAVSDGGAKSYDHYRELCGTIRGLETAQLEINDLVRKLKESEDD